MKASAAEFTRGFGLAIAELSRRINNPNAVFETLRDAGYHSLKEFEKAGVEQSDLDKIAECFPWQHWTGQEL